MSGSRAPSLQQQLHDQLLQNEGEGLPEGQLCVLLLYSDMMNAVTEKMRNMENRLRELTVRVCLLEHMLARRQERPVGTGTEPSK